MSQRLIIILRETKYANFASELIARMTGSIRNDIISGDSAYIQTIIDGVLKVISENEYAMKEFTQNQENVELLFDAYDINKELPNIHRNKQMLIMYDKFYVIFEENHTIHFC
jgi:hypothetical protein